MQDEVWSVSKILPGDVISERFSLVLRMGSGSTGVVWSAVDLEGQSGGQMVALKITRYIEDAGSASRIMAFARQLTAQPGRGKQFLCLPNDYIGHEDRDCFIFDLLSVSLRDVISDVSACVLSPLPGSHVRVMAWQIFSGIAFLHKLNVAHTDIKPDNIVLVDSATVEIMELDKTGAFVTKVQLRNPQIKIVDFDDAKDTGLRSWNHIGTMNYQAPEILCGIGWTKSVDIFSAACTVYELYMGRQFLPATSDPLLQIIYLENVLGKIPEEFAFEIKHINPDAFERLSARVKLPKASDLVEERLRRQVQSARPLWRSIRRVDLADLLKRSLAIDPLQRIPAAMALRLTYFHSLVSDV